MIWLSGMIILWNAAMLVIGDVVLGRVMRTLFPLNNAHRIEAYKSALTRKEFWWRISIYTILYVGVNTALIVLLLLHK